MSDMKRMKTEHCYDIDALMKQWPLPSEPIYLASLTPHELDSSIRFIEDTHTYLVNYDNDGKDDNFTSDGIVSTSGIVHNYFQHFDPDDAISKMRKGRNWNEENKYFNMTDDEIKTLWVDNGHIASTRGTWLHGQLERFMNGFKLEESPMASLKPIKQFMIWFKTQFQGKLLPFRTELRFRSCRKLKMTGTADLIAVDVNHPPPDKCNNTLELHIIDWKFSKAIKMSNKYQSGKGCCSKLDDTNYSHYLLQQNIYKYLMETYYNNWTWKGMEYTKVKVVSMKLCVFHENHGVNGLIVDLPDCRELILKMMNDREQSLTLEH